MATNVESSGSLPKSTSSSQTSPDMDGVIMRKPLRPPQFKFSNNNSNSNSNNNNSNNNNNNMINVYTTEANYYNSFNDIKNPNCLSMEVTDGVEWINTDSIVITRNGFNWNSSDWQYKYSCTHFRKGDVILVSSTSKCGTWYRGLNQRTGSTAIITRANTTTETGGADGISEDYRAAVLLDKDATWDSSASNSFNGSPSLTSDDAKFFIDFQQDNNSNNNNKINNNNNNNNAISIVCNSLDIVSPSCINQDEYEDVSKFQIFNVAGVDKEMRPVITFAACRLPPNSTFDHNRLFSYMQSVLDQYVENDYTVVYFHHQLKSKNKPSLRWLWGVYKELDRKYKKNLKRLYIVHPTNFIRIVYTFFKPYISVKFGKKLQYINRLEELETSLYLHQIDIPQDVKRYDDSLKSNKQAQNHGNTRVNADNKPHQQFGVSLSILIERHKQPIPFIVEDCVKYIESTGLDSVGLFRRGPSQAVLNDAKARADKGERLTFTSDSGDIHLAAVLLKMFLRELPEPLLTQQLYEPIKKIHDLEQSQRVNKTRTLLRNLPVHNLELLKYIFKFLTKVIANEETNRMSAGNISIVFGPNLIWSSNESASLITLNILNTFTYMLLSNFHTIFDES